MSDPARLHALLEASAARDPDRAALVEKNRTTTYGELADRAARFAAALRARGIQKGDRVAIVLDGCVEYLIACYGVLAAGAVAVPLCNDTRTKTLLHPLVHSGARAVVLEARNAKYLEGQGAELPALSLMVTVSGPALPPGPDVVVVPFAEMIDQERALHDGGARGDDLAAIHYTSGTTGRAKGVMLAHRNLVANVRSIVEYLRLEPSDSVAMVLPFFYVYGSSVLHTHIAAGGTIVMAGSMVFPQTVLAAIQEHRTTGFSGVPSTFARLLQTSNLGDYDLSSLRYVTQAGAAMTPALTERLRAALPRADIVVMYGQTEASARLAWLPSDQLEKKLGSAGKAIPGVTLKIVDEHGRELPRGELGEICAAGDNVMLGYWNDPEETARVLRPEGLRTGDLGRMDDDGYIWIAGRESELIKSGAHRISPLEIEEVIAQLDEIAECAVTGVPDPMLGEAIAAFVVPANGRAVDPQKVMRQCLGSLPRFKLPAHVHVVDALPKTETGKVQRRRLRELLPAAPPRAPT